MAEIIVQYVLIVLMVLSIAYLIYFLKDKGVIKDDDYYGINCSILPYIESDRISQEDVKVILRTISDAVNFVEHTYTENDNKIKEEKALMMAREAVRGLEFSNQLNDNSLRYMIRLCCALKNNNSKA